MIRLGCTLSSICREDPNPGFRRCALTPFEVTLHRPLVQNENGSLCSRSTYFAGRKPQASSGWCEA